MEAAGLLLLRRLLLLLLGRRLRFLLLRRRLLLLLLRSGIDVLGLNLGLGGGSRCRSLLRFGGLRVLCLAPLTFCLALLTALRGCALVVGAALGRLG